MIKATPALLGESESYEWKILWDLASWRLVVFQVLSLPMGFLYSHDVVIVNELFGVTFLGFSPLFGESLGCE